MIFINFIDELPEDGKLKFINAFGIHINERVLKKKRSNSHNQINEFCDNHNVDDENIQNNKIENLKKNVYLNNPEKLKYEESSINEDGDDEHEDHTDHEIKSENIDLLFSDSESIVTDGCCDHSVVTFVPNKLNESQKKLEDLKNHINSNKFKKKIEENIEEPKVEKQSWFQMTSNAIFNFFKSTKVNKNINKISTDYTDSESDDSINSNSSMTEASEISQDEIEEVGEQNEPVSQMDLEKNIQFMKQSQRFQKSNSSISFETKKIKNRKIEIKPNLNKKYNLNKNKQYKESIYESESSESESDDF